MKKNRGITLIALVITIIVLVILATVTLNWALGNGGIFTKVFLAKDMAQMEAGREKLGLKVFELQTEKLIKGEPCPLEYINENLEARLEGGTIVGVKGEPIEKIYVKLNGYQYEIIETGEINFIGDVEFSQVPDLDIIRDKTVTGVEKVILDLFADVEIGNIKKIITPIGERIEKNFTYEITKNGEYEFKAVTDKNIETTKKISIQNIREEGLDLTGLTTGDEISHNHIYENKYDEVAHWEECFICHNIINRVNHTIKTEWTYGYESCRPGNYCTTYCTRGCGYSKQTTKPHNFTGASGTSYYKHWKRCIEPGCSVVGAEERCYQLINGKKVEIFCGQEGTCAVCKFIYNKKNTYHSIDNAGNCQFCDKVRNIVSSTGTLEYNNSNNTVVMKCIITVQAGIQFKDDWWVYMSQDGMTTTPITIKRLSNTQEEVSATLTIKEGYFNKMPATIAGSLVAADGFIAYYEVGVGRTPNMSYIIPDRVAPTVKSVNFTGADNVNGFSKKGTITATFTEAKDSVVQIALFDGETMITNWETATKNGTEFTKTFDIISETASSKNLTVKAKDRCDNIGVGTVKIERLDSKAPELISKTEYNDIWSIRKNARLEMKDEGIGKVEIAFNNVNEYKNLIQEGNNYIKNYNFIGDVYQDVIGALYLKDGLGNITTKKITIGKIDSTSPTIINVSNIEGVVTIQANDVNTSLNKEGSGVIGYAISKSKEVPVNAMFQTNNEFKNLKEGTYYVYVKDRAGNLSEKQEIII